MSLVQELIDAISDDSPVADLRVGLHWTVLLTADGRSGIANANAQSHEHGIPDISETAPTIGVTIDFHALDAHIIQYPAGDGNTAAYDGIIHRGGKGPKGR